MHRFFAALGRFSVRFRWVVLAVWIVGTLACAHLLPSLSSVVQNDNTSFLPSSSPSVVASQLATPLENSKQVHIPVIVVTTGGALSSADQQAIGTLRGQLAEIADVAGVQDAGVSQDGQADLLNVDTSATGGGAMIGQSEITTLVDDVEAVLAKAQMPTGLQAHISGAQADNVADNSKGGKSSNKVQLYSVLLIVLLLFLVFRSLLAPIITLIPPLLVVTASGPLIAEAADHGLQVSQIAQLLLIVLVLGAGTDYGLFLMFRVREEIRRGLPHREAVVRAVERVGESITFSAGTVIAALLSLLAATFGMYSNLGVPLAIGMALMLLAGLTLLPALLAIFGRAVFWPSKLRATGDGSGWWGRIAARIVERPVVTLTAGLLLFGGLALASTQYQPGGFGGTTTPPAGSDAAIGDALVAQHFPKTSSAPTQIVLRLGQSAWTDPQVLETAQQQLAADRDFTGVTGPLSPNGVTLTPQQLAELYAAMGAPENLPRTPGAGMKLSLGAYEVYRATAPYISADGMTVLYDVQLAAGPSSSTAAMHAIPAVRVDAQNAAQKIGATGEGVVGQAAGLYDVSSTSDSDLKTVVPIAILIIGLLLALVMRSMVAPLYLIASVALSYLAALGAAVLIFMKLGGDQGLEFILPFMLFLFLMALGEDYNILVMTRIREEAHHLGLRQAVAKAVGATGTTVTSAGLILAGTFAVLALVGSSSNNTQIEDVGAGLAIGILMDTFLVRTLLVPATVVLLGRWNWWPSKLQERHDELTEDDQSAPVPSGLS